MEHIPTKRTRISLNPGIYGVVDLNNTLKLILPNNVKITITIDDIRLKSNLKINQTLMFTEKSFFYTNLGFTQSRCYPLYDIEGIYQLIAETYKSDRPINITGIDKVHLKCDCIQGSIVNGIREPILDSFALSSPPGHKIYKDPRIKLFKEVNKSVLSHIMFYLEDDDHKPVDFHNESVSFTCQLIKISNSVFYTYYCMSIYTRGIHTILFGFISETYLELHLYYYYKYKSIYISYAYIYMYISN